MKSKSLKFIFVLSLNSLLFLSSGAKAGNDEYTSVTALYDCRATQDHELLVLDNTVDHLLKLAMAKEATVQKRLDSRSSVRYFLSFAGSALTSDSQDQYHPETLHSAFGKKRAYISQEADFAFLGINIFSLRVDMIDSQATIQTYQTVALNEQITGVNKGTKTGTNQAEQNKRLLHVLESSDSTKISFQKITSEAKLYGLNFTLTSCASQIAALRKSMTSEAASSQAPGVTTRTVAGKPDHLETGGNHKGAPTTTTEPAK